MRHLLSATPAPLTPGGGFDAYNIYWPGVTLLGAVASVTMGAGPEALAPLLAPAVGASVVVLLCALLMELGLGRTPAAAAGVLFGLYGGEAIMSAAVTKEGFAFPVMLLFLLLFARGRRSRPSLVLSVPAFVSLVIYHHLTAVMGVFLAATMVVAFAIGGGSDRHRLAVQGAMALAFAAGLGAYFALYTSSVVLAPFGPDAFVSAAAYVLFFTLPVALAFLVAARPSRVLFAWSLTVLGVIAAMAAASSRYQLFLAAPAISPVLEALALPYLMTGLAAALAFRTSGRSVGAFYSALWATATVGLAAFALFGTPGVLGWAYRLASFLMPAVCAMACVWLVKLPGRGAPFKWAAAAAFVLLSAGSALAVPYAAFYAGPVGGSQRVFQHSDISAGAWYGSNRAAGANVSGDARASFLFSLDGVPVDSGGGVLYADGLRPLAGCFMGTRLMGQIGFIGPDYGFSLPSGRLASLESPNSTAVVYANGPDWFSCSP
jgi:hypothetical protein